MIHIRLREDEDSPEDTQLETAEMNEAHKANSYTWGDTHEAQRGTVLPRDTPRHRLKGQHVPTHTALQRTQTLRALHLDKP